MIEFRNVTKTYHNGDGRKKTVILDDISLSIGSGEFVCVLGPSGCGKTTLLNLVAGFVLPNSGEMLFNGKKIERPGPERAVVFQDPTLFPWLTVRQNVMFGLCLDKSSRHCCREISHRYLEITGLLESADAFPFALSGGMRQRVSLARVLALDPGVLLMDEPFSALDANTREHLQDELLKLWNSYPRTVVYVTHSVGEAAYLADRIVVLDGSGHIRKDMPIDLPRPRNRSSQELLELKSSLRTQLVNLPCCIMRTGKKRRS